MPLSAHAAGLTPSQLKMADLVEREFAAAGFGTELAIAAVTNAYAESRLNPTARYATMYGLFQLANPGGAGEGLTVAQMYDPVVNTRRIIKVLKGWQGEPLLSAYKTGERNAARLAGLFAIHVERPKNKAARALEREGLAYDLFPGLVKSTSAVFGGSTRFGATSSVVALAHGLTSSQVAMASLIEQAFLAAGLPMEIAVAAIVNSYAESRLNPDAMMTEKDGSRSVGLFQLRDNGGLGTNMSVEARRDPATNIATFLAAVQGSAGRQVRAAFALGERDVGRLAYLVCVYIERPADPVSKGLERRALAIRLFPGLFTLHRLLSDPHPGDNPLVYYGLAAAVGVVVWGGWRLSQGFTSPRR